MKVVTVVPTYNEASNLPGLLQALLAQPIPGLHVLVVDDESPDGTGRLAEELALRSPGRIDVMHRQGVRGLGRAYVDGFQWALGQGADVVVQMDADLSHSPADVPRLLAGLDGADLVIGSRYVPGGSVDEHWGFGRNFLSRSANALSRSLLGLATHDATSGFRGWTRRALESVDPGRMVSNGYLLQVEMVYLSEKLGLRIAEIPIYFADRKIGLSKMSLRVKIEAALGLLRVWRTHHKVHRLG